jgi:hypothetical protein
VRLLSLLLGLLSVEASAVVLAWNRSVDTDVTGYRMHYGPAGGIYDTVLDVGDVSQASIGGLTPGASYDFAATAYDGSGNESVYSNEVSYTEPPLPGDTQPPVVTLTRPLNGALVPRGGTVMLIATASDDVGVSWVQFLVQGQAHDTVGQSPYQCLWQVPHAANKSYTVQAMAQDAAGNIGWSALVTVRTE